MSVHPRMCGERGGTLYRCRGHGGSSPHVRGTRAGHVRGFAGDRFIPACAGNATGSIPDRRKPSVHPRMCGERALSFGVTFRAAGSSPHVRGTHTKYAFPVGAWRFIPACAGNAGRRGLEARQVAVHPRMCGERPHTTPLAVTVHGSSPHVRGTHDCQALIRVGQRFIPACAGNALVINTSAIRETVHPRMCGERSGELHTS